MGRRGQRECVESSFRATGMMVSPRAFLWGHMVQQSMIAPLIIYTASKCFTIPISEEYFGNTIIRLNLNYVVEGRKSKLLP